MNRRARWFAVCIFAFASTWNYLDRSLIGAQAPRIRSEFHLSNEGYGWLLAAFSLAYALAAPATGWLLDRLGLNRGIAVCVGFWSVATALTGITNTFGQLLACRALLGVWESAGVPAAGKLNATYLEPKNRAIGAAVTQIGISIGSSGAYLMAAQAANWRTPFFLCGLLGLLWIPVWLIVARRVPQYSVVLRQERASLALLRDRRLILLSISNMLWMLSYLLWTFWTTPYLNYRFHLTTERAAAYAWFPPLASVLGGFAGGWLSRRRIDRGASAAEGRIGAIFISALGCLMTLLVPICHTPGLATAMIGVSFFWSVAGSVNLYTIPVDLWGAERAGTAISALVFSFGLMSAAVSPVIGRMVDRGGYGGVLWMVAIPPMLAWALIRFGVQNTPTALDVQSNRAH